MKTKTLSFIFGCLLASSNLFAQLEIPNGDFETWGYYNTWTLDPASWECSNFQLANHVIPDSMAYEGNRAMRVYPYGFFESAPGYASVEFAADAIPASVDFAVKAYIDGLDSVSVRVAFINTNGGEDWIIQESKVWYTDTSIPEWQVISIPLDQVEPVIDRCLISVIAGYGQFFLEGSLDTWISVDAMGFEGLINTINPISTNNEVRLYYSTSQAQFLTLGLQNPELVERVNIYSSHGALVQSRSDFKIPKKLASGIYTYKFVHKGVQYTGKFATP